MKPLVLALAALALPATYAQELPEGKGKDLVASYCAGCHGLGSVTSQKSDKEGWETIVNYMVSRGLSATDDELKIIVDYLATAFPQAPAPAKPKPADQGKGK